jgi:hypothetical protein
MTRTAIKSQMLLRTDGSQDELMMYGSMTGQHFDGDPCVIASTESMGEAATFVYLPLEDAVADIMDEMDAKPADEMEALIRAAVERGIASGRKKREEDGRL